MADNGPPGRCSSVSRAIICYSVTTLQPRDLPGLQPDELVFCDPDRDIREFRVPLVTYEFAEYLYRREKQFVSTLTPAEARAYARGVSAIVPELYSNIGTSVQQFAQLAMRERLVQFLEKRLSALAQQPAEMIELDE